MMQQSSKEFFMHLAKTARRVAVFREMEVSDLSFMDIAEKLQDELSDGAILESDISQGPLGQHSLITFGTVAQLSAQSHQAVTIRMGKETTYRKTSVFDTLRELTKEFSCVGLPKGSEFISSAVGFLTYDAVRLFEEIPDRHPANNLPEVLFNFYRIVLLMDHRQQTLLINIAVEIKGDIETNYQLAQQEIEQLIHKINQPIQTNCSDSLRSPIESPVQVDISDDEFLQMIHKAKQYIISGDAFQIVLSRCFKKSYRVSPFHIYQTLRKVSPTPYMFYLPFESHILLGASPEKMISVHNREVSINPIAGTRPRDDKKTSQAIEAELLNDTKERAEHMMLVDLARNDLGVVCQSGSISIQELLHVKHYSHISHITSTITGQLREDKDAFDALAASFPAGTLSGAPKIRAMQIIDELETSRRGIYGGAICRIGYQGNLDSCIAIRMAVLSEGVATVRTGAGIVYDSNPQSEANETRQKAHSILEAIRRAERISCY